ncbi:hypothetical protein JTB14_002555 [Gonioctena quinquepunctata]|nr:hypothetical protein JTB14_002555 [Gonioctena quinquepunctata]
MNRVVFGTASAPYLAVRCLFQLGVDFEKTHPGASNTIKSDFYVDDCLTGSDDQEDDSYNPVFSWMELQNPPHMPLRRCIIFLEERNVDPEVIAAAGGSFFTSLRGVSKENIIALIYLRYQNFARPSQRVYSIVLHCPLQEKLQGNIPFGLNNKFWFGSAEEEGDNDDENDDLTVAKLLALEVEEVNKDELEEEKRNLQEDIDINEP